MQWSHHTIYENKIVFQDKYSELLIDLSTSFINLPIEQIDDAIEEALGKISSFVGADRAYIFDYDFVNQTSSNMQKTLTFEHRFQKHLNSVYTFI